MHYPSAQTTGQITPNYSYKCVCALHSPSPNLVFSGKLLCWLLQAPVVPVNTTQWLPKPRLPLFLDRHFCKEALSKLPPHVSLGTCALQSIYAAPAWNIKPLLLQLMFSGSWVCLDLTVEIHLPSNTLFQPYDELCFSFRLLWVLNVSISYNSCMY